MNEHDIKFQDARKTISEIDEKIAALFEERMRAVEVVADYKKIHGLPIEDPVREARLLETNSQLISDEAIRSYYIKFQKNVMRLSKEYQRKLNDGM